MKPETIHAIFTNLLFVIGVILVIIGFTRGALAITRIFVFDKYPLGYDETRCDMGFPQPIVLDNKPESINSEDVKQQKEKCLVALENDRKARKVEDIVSSLSFFIAGVALAYSFRSFISSQKQ